MRTKFDVNLLNTFATENDIELIGNYEKLTRESIINGTCKNKSQILFNPIFFKF